MEFFFLKQELRNRIIRRLEGKIKINDWIAMVLGISGTMFAVLAVRIGMVDGWVEQLLLASEG